MTSAQMNPIAQSEQVEKSSSAPTLPKSNIPREQVLTLGGAKTVSAEFGIDPQQGSIVFNGKQLDGIDRDVLENKRQFALHAARSIVAALVSDGQPPHDSDRIHNSLSHALTKMLNEDSTQPILISMTEQSRDNGGILSQTNIKRGKHLTTCYYQTRTNADSSVAASAFVNPNSEDGEPWWESAASIHSGPSSLVINGVRYTNRVQALSNNGLDPRSFPGAVVPYLGSDKALRKASEGIPDIGDYNFKDPAAIEEDESI